MTTVDLTTTELPALPRRVSLSLPELRWLGAQAGDVPLPFRADEPERTGGDGALSSRLGRTPEEAAAARLRELVASLPPPRESLAGRGLLHTDGTPHAELLGAVGLLGAPEVALDVDLALSLARPVHAKAWHRLAGGNVACLSTLDGLRFELAWLPATRWADELTRVATVPAAASGTASGSAAARPAPVNLPVGLPVDVPRHVDLPYELLDAGGEAIRSGREDLLAVLVGFHSGQVRDAAGDPLDDATVDGVLRALTGSVRGRMRGLVTAPPTTAARAGVLSWLLTPDGWRRLEPHGDHRVRVSPADPSDLGPAVARLVSEVRGRE